MCTSGIHTTALWHSNILQAVFFLFCFPPRPAVHLSHCICVLAVMREITIEVLEPHSFTLAHSSNNRPLIASLVLRRERESEHEAERERKRKKNTVREMAGGYGSSSITITLLLQRDLLIQCKIDT